MENQGRDERRFGASKARPDCNASANLNSEDSTHIYALKRLPPRGGIVGAWRVMLRRQGRHISRTFKDSAYGSAEAALAQAHDYRDTIMQALPPATLREKANCLRRDNTSGISGVYKAHNPQPRWVAYLSSPDGVRTRGYSVSKYGDDKAKHLAIAQRQEWLADIASAFHTVGEESEAVALRQFPERLEHVPDVTSGHLMPREAIDQILAKIEKDFDARRPLRLRVTVHYDANARLRAMVAINKPFTQMKQISVGTRSRLLDKPLALMGHRLNRAITELCGEEVAGAFWAKHAGRLLDPNLLDEERSASVMVYIAES